MCFSLALGAAPAFGSAGADKIALHVRQSAEYRQHQAPGAAGTVNLGLALWQGGALPEPGIMAAAGVTGFLGYGVSLLLFVMGLRYLGSARPGAYFSLAPFIGAVLAISALGESFTVRFAIAGV